MIEKTFIVVVVESFMDGVFIYLKPQDLPMQEQLKVLAPGPQSEDEKMATNVAKTMVLEIQKGFGAPPMPPPISPFVFRLYFPQDEYKELGKPTVNDTIQMQLQTQKEENKCQ